MRRRKVQSSSPRRTVRPLSGGHEQEPKAKEQGGKAALLLRARTAQSQPSVAKCDPQNVLCLALGPPHVTREHPRRQAKDILFPDPLFCLKI